jgi:hypothetical protein
MRAADLLIYIFAKLCKQRSQQSLLSPLIMKRGFGF